jgi:uncharacterized MAPEG superfamily protein
VTTAFTCIAIAFGLIVVTRGMLLFEQRRLGTIDNTRPRRQWRQLKDRGARVLETHADAVESFAPFAAAVLIAHFAGAIPKRIDMLAIAWTIVKVVHPAAHVAEADYLRAGLGAMSWLCVASLFTLALTT